MAAPSYTTDLTLIHACDAASASWTEPTGFTAGAITLPETDYYIQNTGCLSKNCGTTTPAGVGAIYNAGSGLTIPSPGAVMTWLFFGAPNTLATQASGGLQVFVGSATSAFYQYYVRGADTYPYGGWICIPVDPAVTADTQTGSPSATKQYFGAGASIPGSAIASKGNPFGLDVLRYGRCEARMNGGEGGDPTNYATFSGFAGVNDTTANRWGLIQSVQGGYLVQGLVILGYSSAVDFRDSNKSILIADTQKVISSFNAFEVRQSTSRVDMTSITFLALGTTARGNWITTDNADINIDGCSFTNMGTFSFLSASTIVGSTFRGCDLVTQGGGTFDGCTFDDSRASASILSGNPSLITNCTFQSDGSNHALQLTTAGTYNLTNLTFVGYATTDGSTGNEVIYNNSEGAVTLNASGITGTISVRNSTNSTTTVVSGAVTVTLTAQTADGTLVPDATVFVPVSAGPLPYQAAIDSIDNTGTTAVVTTTVAHGLLTNDKVYIRGASLNENLGVFTITVTGANTFEYTMTSTPTGDPTGTITFTFVILEGKTNTNEPIGQISMSRVFPGTQPFNGWARKSTKISEEDPVYKEGIVTGSVSTTTGAQLIALMILDE